MKRQIATMVYSILLTFSFASLASDNPVTESDKKFFYAIQKAVVQKDSEWLSKAIGGYPFTINLKQGNLKLTDEKDFKKYAKTIFNQKLIDDVKNQSSESLFKNWQGVMIGNGDIWFSEMGQKKGTNVVWAYQIIAINIPAE